MPTIGYLPVPLPVSTLRSADGSEKLAMPNGYSGSLKRFELRLSLLEVMCLVVCGSEFTRLIIHVFDHFRVL